MEIEGIDRVVIGVKDMDGALGFFSRVLGVEMTEMRGDSARASGCRIAVSLDKKLELISPVGPFTARHASMNPPDPLALARRLEAEGAGILYALIFKVKDLDEAIAQAERHKVHVVGNRIEKERHDEVPIKNMKEVVLSEDDTFGIKMALVEFESTR